ncbi:hypothetical protein B0H63DRAFT_455489 [Podospora didyma]|uniref:Uncharacterized protein n=1 Tax=Podospora didyma TaxID=330526 RepID=A0AAE0K303_9PEZI|nr:hypothetical protein B0H63DRAFT_455489 [Podospora didyma]
MRFSSVLVVLGAAFAAASPLQARGEVNDELAQEAPASTVSSRDLEEPANQLLVRADAGSDEITAETPKVELGPADPAPPNATAETKRDLEARAYQSLTWTHNWNLGSVTGDHLITFWSSGSVRFKTHFHNSGWWSYDYGINCALRDVGGRVYTLSRKGRVKGKIEFWASHNADADETRFNNQVKLHWADIVNGNKLMYCKVRTTNSISWDALKSLLNDVLSIIKTVGPIVAAIAIF